MALHKFGKQRPGKRERPLVAHILDRLDVGGLETVMIELINATGSKDLHHVVICMSGYTDFRHRIRGVRVDCHSMGKRPGKDPGAYWRLWRLLRAIKPDLVQTYNIGALDTAVAARLAGVRAIAHAEHGRTADDPTGSNIKYNRLRRLLSPFVGRYIAVSKDLEHWLRDVVGLPESKVTHIYNGVDLTRYKPAQGKTRRSLFGAFAPDGTILFATVGRLDPVKDHAGLIRAFAGAVAAGGNDAATWRLLIVGDGPEAQRLVREARASGCEHQILLAGPRGDVPSILAEVDVFVSSSVAEGIALTILEAMACAKPVIATAVGGNPELVSEGENGLLVPASDVPALAGAIGRYATQPALAARHGQVGRDRVMRQFSLEAMVAAYLQTYRELLKRSSYAVEASA